MKKLAQQPFPTHEVINQFGEQLSSGTYMECLAFVQTDCKGQEGITIEDINLIES